MRVKHLEFYCKILDSNQKFFGFSKSSIFRKSGFSLTWSVANWTSFVSEHTSVTALMTASVNQPTLFGFVERHSATRTSKGSKVCIILHTGGCTRRPRISAEKRRRFVGHQTANRAEICKGQKERKVERFSDSYVTLKKSIKNLGSPHPIYNKSVKMPTLVPPSFKIRNPILKLEFFE